MASRNAPFTFADVAAGGTVSRQVIFGGQGGIYRFFNSSDRHSPQDKQLSLEVSYNSVAVAVKQTLYPTLSIDVAIGPSNDTAGHPVGVIAVAKNTAVSAQTIRGSFDLIRDAANRVTSEKAHGGRFNLPPRVPAAISPLMVADLTFSTGVATYRFVNTGEKDFKIVVAGAWIPASGGSFANTVFEVDLKPTQAVDFDVSDMTHRKVFVARLKNGPPPIGTPVDGISGVYEIIR